MRFPARSKSVLMLLAFVFLAGVFLAPVAHADGVSLTTSVFLRGETSISTFPTCSQTSSTGRPVATSECNIPIITNTDANGTLGSELSGAAISVATFGALGVADLAAASCFAFSFFGCPMSMGASSTASFSDTLSISNAPSLGFIQLLLKSTGGTLCTAGGFGSPMNCAASVEVTDQNGNSFFLLNGGNATIDTYSYSGTSDIPLSLSMLGQAGCSVGVNPDFGTVRCVAIVNFKDTLEVTGINVLDANGNLVAGADITAASGTNYNAGVSPVPEPSSVMLLASGFLMLLLVRRRSILHKLIF
jgi:hypothetical protein